MIQMNSDNGEMKIALILRDKDGNPRFDDWNNIDEIFHSVLSEQDWEFIKRKQRGE